MQGRDALSTAGAPGRWAPIARAPPAVTRAWVRIKRSCAHVAPQALTVNRESGEAGHRLPRTGMKPELKLLARPRSRQRAMRAGATRVRRPVVVMFLDRRIGTGRRLPTWFRRFLLLARLLAGFGTDLRVIALEAATRQGSPEREPLFA